jgi:hypothetical protein
MNKKLASVGISAPSKGSMNPPRRFMRRFLTEEITRLSATLRSTDLCLLNFRLVQCDSFPFNTFRTLSLILFNSSRFPFTIMAFRNLGCADLST